MPIGTIIEGSYRLAIVKRRSLMRHRMQPALNSRHPSTPHQPQTPLSSPQLQNSKPHQPTAQYT